MMESFRFTNSGKYAIILPYEKLCEKESTHGNALQRDSHGKISGLRGNVQEHMEDGFGEALLNVLGSDRTACYSGKVCQYLMRFPAARRK